MSSRVRFLQLETGTGNSQVQIIQGIFSSMFWKPRKPKNEDGTPLSHTNKQNTDPAMPDLIIITVLSSLMATCGLFQPPFRLRWRFLVYGVQFGLLLHAHTHRSILGAAGHIILTPANQLMVMGLKIWSLSNPGMNQRPFDRWPTSLPPALTGPTRDPENHVRS
jgi:hypothetical protein